MSIAKIGEILHRNGMSMPERGVSMIHKFIEVGDLFSAAMTWQIPQIDSVQKGDDV